MPAKKLEHTMIIVGALRAGMRTSRNLARMLDVTPRTVYRRIEDARRYGYDIRGEAGVGYMIFEKMRSADKMSEIDPFRYYAVLDVPQSATSEQIKAAYRRLAKEHHPDKGGDPNIFATVCEAYTVLSDTSQRQLYDETGCIDAKDPFHEQRFVIEAMAQAFHVIIQKTPHPIEQVDIVEEMKNLMSAGIEKCKTMRSDYVRRLESLRKARSRVIRSSESENLFQLAIDTEIRKLAPKEHELTLEIRRVQRALDELDAYESIVDVVRHVQWAAYPGDPDGMSPFGTLGDYTVTRI